MGDPLTPAQALIQAELLAVDLAEKLSAAHAREAQLREALLMCEDALVDGALDWHDTHTGRGEGYAEDCAVCVVANALVSTWVPAPLPCGHPFSAVVSADEGTSYCGECASGQDGETT